MILQQSFLCLHYCTQRGGRSGSRITNPIAYHRHWLFTSCPRWTTKFCNTKSWETSIEKLGWVSSSYHMHRIPPNMHIKIYHTFFFFVCVAYQDNQTHKCEFLGVMGLSCTACYVANLWSWVFTLFHRHHKPQEDEETWVTKERREWVVLTENTKDGLRSSLEIVSSL